MPSIHRLAALAVSIPLSLVLSLSLIAGPAAAEAVEAPGFQGIWYAIGTGDGIGDHGPKYGGGLATYPQQHAPIAIHRPEAGDAGRTYFLFGGRTAAGGLGNMISYFDHATGLVARPRVVLHRGGNDAHHNATLAIDDEGHLFVFANHHGEGGSSYIYRSTAPDDITSFDLAEVAPAGATNFSYANPWYISGQGFMLLYNNYTQTASRGDRAIYTNTSPNGTDWGDWHAEARPRVADINRDGHYQTTWRFGDTVAMAFNWHEHDDLDQRTNLYYLETADLGSSWQTAGGATITTPVTAITNAALVHDYRSEGLNVYLKDVQRDAAGNPVLLYLTSAGSAAGPASGQRTLHTARWDGSDWIIRDLDPSLADHNYDHGSLFIDDDGAGNEIWRLIGPFLDGPQAWATGGHIGVWTSPDQGLTWTLEDELTAAIDNGNRNHTYLRRVLDADDDFVALWADGNAYTVGDTRSHLYFSDRLGNVYRLPYAMDSAFAAPELVRAIPEPSAFALLLLTTPVLLARRRRALHRLSQNH